MGSRFACSHVILERRLRLWDDISGDLKTRTAHLPPTQQEELLQQMKVAEALIRAGRLSPIAFDTFRNRWEAVVADGRCTEDEGQHLLRLLKDFPHWRDEVHAIKYMGQR